MKKYLIHRIRTVSTKDSGGLSFIEASKDIPFKIKRVYYIHQVPRGVKRGGHAHKELEQLLFCPYGKIEIVVDDGNEKEKYVLDSPDKGLYIGNGVWRDMIWHQDNSVLCVAVSRYYDEEDYIRDYKQFIELVIEGYWDDKKNHKL